MLQKEYLVLYRDRESGKIHHHQKLQANAFADDSALKAEIDKFNAKEDSSSAELVCLSENDIVEYLLRQVEMRERYTKESIDDAISALEQARDCILSLEMASETT